MNLRDLIASAVSNTFRSKLRTTLTVLAIFVGAFTLTLTNGVGAGVSDYVTKQVDSMGAADVLMVSHKSDATSQSTTPKVYDPATSGTAAGAGRPGRQPAVAPLTDSDLARIRTTPGILSVDPVRQVSPDYIANGSGTKYELTISPTSAIAKADLVAGKQLDINGSQLQLELPETYVTPLGFGSAQAAVGSTVKVAITDVLGKQKLVDATVAGVARTSVLVSGVQANQPLIQKLSTVQAAGISTGTPKYGQAVAHFDARSSAAQVTSLKNTLDADGYSALTVKDQLGTLQTVIDGIIGVLNAFAIIALIAAAFGIINTLLMSVQERTREIGLMKAMGMSGGKVYTLFSLEAVVIGFLGSAIGTGVAIGVGSVLSRALANGPLSGLPGLNILLFRPGSVAFVILLVMAIAFLAGTLPARRAARQNPIESLRYE